MGSNIPEFICVSYKVNTERSFFKYVTENKDAICATLSGMPLDDAIYQVELAISFMKFYMGEDESDGLLDQPTAKHDLYINLNKSPFEILLDIHSAMRATCVGYSLYLHGNNPSLQAFVKKLLEFPNFEIMEMPIGIKLPSSNWQISYCTMVVFEASDLHSATDLLAKSWTNSSVPWAIRNLLVQECVHERFIQILLTKLKPFQQAHAHFDTEMNYAVNYANKLGLRLIQNPDDKNTAKPTIVFGSSVEFLLPENAISPSPVIVMNVFRTAKEAITIANKVNGGSFTVWTEELSMAFEIGYALNSSTIWLNCHGVFNPLFAYNFRKDEFCYGSEYAIAEKKVKTFIEQPENSEDNRSPLEKLGICPPKVTNRRFSLVRCEKNVHFEMISLPYNVDQYKSSDKLKIVDNFWEKFTTLDEPDINILFDCVYNQRKTLVIPYGVSFGN